MITDLIKGSSDFFKTCLNNMCRFLAARVCFMTSRSFSLRAFSTPPGMSDDLYSLGPSTFFGMILFHHGLFHLFLHRDRGCNLVLWFCHNFINLIRNGLSKILFETSNASITASGLISSSIASTKPGQCLQRYDVVADAIVIPFPPQKRALAAIPMWPVL